MKKILLSCLIGLGISANAQIYTSNGFQNFGQGAGDEKGWAYSVGGFVPGATSWAYWDNPSYFSCNTVTGNVYYGGMIGTNNGYFDSVYTPSETANGEAISCSVTFRKFASASSTANIAFDYSLDGGTTWAALGAKQDFSDVCTTKTEVIPAGVVTASNSSQFRFRVRGTRTGSTGSNPYYWIDDIKLVQTVTVIPSCPVISVPANGATNISVRPTFSWTGAAGAQSYKLSIGTTSGGTDILNNVTVSSGYIPAINTILSPNTKYYVKLIANNTIGDSLGCTESTFTTGANPLAPYCGPIISNAPNQIAPITSVDLAGIAYTSDVTANNIGSFEPHQVFVDKIFTVKDNVTTVPITVKAIGIANNGWAMSVFIDWNNDGNFDGVGESYFNTTATMIRTTSVAAGNIVTLTGNLPIPAGTSLGNKRIRIKYNYSDTNINLPLTTACADLTNGQVEDYTINYEKYLAVADINKTNVSVYPNPFKGVLKISDVKDAKSINIADASGRVVATPKVSPELNLSYLSKGVYFVTINYENGSVRSFKVVKE